MEQQLSELIAEIKPCKYAGSSISKNTIYHDLPFDEFNQIKSHRKGTKERWSLIESKSGIVFDNSTVVDFGCSIGAFSLFAASKEGAKVIGYDYDHESIALATYAALRMNLGDSIKFLEANIDLNFIKSLNYHIDITLWLSQWMWSVKQYGLESAKDMLFEVSKKSNTLVFESAANDARAAIKDTTQDTINKWLWENTIYSKIKDIGYVEGWHNRHIFVCQIPIYTWNGFTAKLVRIDRNTVRKTFRVGFEWMVKREIEAYRRLSQYDYYFPKLLNSGPNYIDINYCGNREFITDKNKLLEILNILKIHKITHRDIRPENLLTLNGKLSLIDFAWCLFDGEKESPVAPPQNCLGSKWYLGNRGNDNYAVTQIIKEFKL